MNKKHIVHRACLLLTLPVFLILASCSKLDNAKEAISDKTVEIAIEKAAGPDSEVNVSGSEITIKKNGRIYEIVLGEEALGGEENTKSRIPIAPGAKLVSHVSGVNDESLTFIHSAGIDDVESFFTKVFDKSGYKKLVAISGTGSFTGQWLIDDSGLQVSIYAYNKVGGSKYITLLSRGG